MRLLTIICVAAVTTTLCTAEQPESLWSWSGNTEESKTTQTYAIESQNPSGSAPTAVAEEASSNYNETVLTVDEVIDTILSSQRQGRNLDGFDEVYSDPTVQDAIQKGDDSQARNLIKDKLCTLGLMQCDNEESVEGKRPFLAGEYIYSQQPPINGPYRGPNNHGLINGPPRPPSKIIYGAPRPMPNNFGPPRKVGYAASSRPIYSGLSGPIISGGPPPDFQGPIYHSKPPGPVFEAGNPYKYESFNTHQGHSDHHEFPGGVPSAPKPTIVVNAQGGAATNGQEGANSVNIHHHYHHVDKDANKPVIVSVPVPVSNAIGSSEFSSHHGGGGSGFNSLNQGFNSGNGFDYQSFKHGASAGGFSASSGYGSGVKPVFESVNNFDSQAAANNGPALFGTSGSQGLGGSIGSISSQGLGGSINSYGQSTAGFGNGNGGSFHSGNPDYYKKALNGNSGYNALGSNQQISGGYAGQYGSNYNGGNFNGGNYNGDNYQSIDAARQDNFDCVCVPFEQCPARDVFGRKGDLILPLDPRNLGTDIEAVSDDENSNSTVSAPRVVKEAKDDKEVQVEDNKEIEKKESELSTEIKSVSKRDVSDKKSDEVIEKADGEGRLFGIGSPGAAGVGLGKKKIEPQFGVSFGLPYPTGGYPLNTLNGGYPAQNPYFGSISPNGLNLGLVNVNPLVSFQFAKNEYGEKLFKPLVNLHVTPNENIIHKVGSLFKQKKHGYEGGPGLQNQHYHSHTHYPAPPPVYHPNHYETGQFGSNEYYGSGQTSGHYGLSTGPGQYGLGSPSQYGNSGPSQYGISGPSQYGINGPSQYGIGGPSQHGISGPGNYYGGSGPGEYYREGPAFAPSGPAFAPSGPAGNPNDGYYQGPSGPSDYDTNGFYSRSLNGTQGFEPSVNNYQNTYSDNTQNNNGYASNYNNYDNQNNIKNTQTNDNEHPQSQSVSFPSSRRKRSTENDSDKSNEKNAEQSSARSANIEKRQSFNQIPQQCGPRHVCCRRPAPQRPAAIQAGQCGRRNTNGITGRIKTPVYVDGDSEFGEYPWQVAILKKDPKESVYICGGTLIDNLHIATAAHCVKQYTHFDLRVRLGEWDVNHDVEFFPYIERDIIAVTVHPEYYAGTLDNDLAILTLNNAVDFANSPHISPACLPDKFSDFSGQRCFTTGWGKDAFGDYGKYQNILKEVDVPIIGQQQCQQQLRSTRLGYTYNLNPGFLCAGGEEGKDACKGDGGGPLVCERNGVWQLVGVVSWGIGCGQVNVPGVYVKVSHYIDWIQQILQQRF